MTMQWQMCYTLLSQHIPFESVYISTEIFRLHIKVILLKKKKKKKFFPLKSMVIMANRPLFKLDLQQWKQKKNPELFLIRPKTKCFLAS